MGNASVVTIGENIVEILAFCCSCDIFNCLLKCSILADLVSKK